MLTDQESALVTGHQSSAELAALHASWRASGLWSDQSLAQVLERSLRTRSDLTLRVWSENHPFEGTFADLLDGAMRFRFALQRLGIKPGDRILLQIPNWAESLVALVGTVFAGAVIVPLAPFYGPRERLQALLDSEARLLVIPDRVGQRDYVSEVDGQRGDAPALEHVVVIGENIPAHCLSFWPLIHEAPLVPGIADRSPDDLALLAFTSGTTGRAKGVLHTSRSLVSEGAHHLPVALPVQAPQLNASPLSHISGFCTTLLVPILRGDSIHILERWDPDFVVRASKAGHLSIGNGVPMMLQSVIDRSDFSASDFGPTRVVTMGGSSILESFCQTLVDFGLEVIRTYGSTEQPVSTASSEADPIGKRMKYDGRALPGVELRIVDEADKPVGPNVAGELWTRGPDLCAGYLDAATTTEAFTPEGWFRTGDIAVVDQEGWLKIVDRKKDLIIRSGLNISAREVEVLLEAHPSIAEVAVVSQPNHRTGERAVAVIRTTVEDTALDIADLQYYLRKMGLAQHKWPEGVVTVGEIPRTPTGKVAKHELRERIRHLDTD